jgi:hypothetical protein
MITSSELSWIKEAQKEYKKKFDKKLIIDFPSMAGVNDLKDLEQVIENHRKFGAPRRVAFKSTTFLNSLLEKYNLTLEEVQQRGKAKHNGPKTQLLIEFCTTCYHKPWDLDDCAEQIGKNRSTIYYYADREYYKAIRKKTFIDRKRKKAQFKEEGIISYAE